MSLAASLVLLWPSSAVGQGSVTAGKTYNIDITSNLVKSKPKWDIPKQLAIRDAQIAAVNEAALAKQRAEVTTVTTKLSVQTEPTTPINLPPGSHTDWMAQAGIASADYGYVDYIVMHEGSWDPCVINGGAVDCSYAATGGQRAYGIGQALPGIKMSPYGSDWATNPITQLRWAQSYALARYGSWQNAYNYWTSHGNW